MTRVCLHVPFPCSYTRRWHENATERTIEQGNVIVLIHKVLEAEGECVIVTHLGLYEIDGFCTSDSRTRANAATVSSTALPCAAAAREPDILMSGARELHGAD